MKKHQLTLSASLLGALLVGCTTTVIPYAGQPTSLIANSPVVLPSLGFPTPTPEATPDPNATPGPIVSLEPGVLMIASVEPRRLQAGDTLTITGEALDRIGSSDISLVWDLPDRQLPVVLDQQSATRLSLTFPAFPAGTTQVSLHLLQGKRTLQGYVLVILPGGAEGTPFPAVTPSASTSPSPGQSPETSPSPGESPTASPSDSPSPEPSATVSASPSPEATASASQGASQAG
ncbi:MAG: hypothetical protein ACAI44_32410 [Candidatus Sericytochromatia bacterium]